MCAHTGLYEAAFDEFRVTRQTSTGNGDAYCALWRMPGWFVRDELGYDGPIGTRLHNLVPQTALERRHKSLLARATNPKRKRPTKKAKKQSGRETKYSRRAKLEQIEVRAVIDEG